MVSDILLTKVKIGTWNERDKNKKKLFSELKRFGVTEVKFTPIIYREI